MPLLTKFVYGLQTDSKKTPFGLLNNQVKTDNIIQSAGWFNMSGDRLGCGDLTLADMAHIAKNIPTNEMFIVVSEANCEWNLPSHIDRTSPGFDYVMSKATWVMAKSNVGSVVLRIRDDIEKAEDAEKDGLKYLRMPRAELYKAMATKPTKPAPVDYGDGDSDNHIERKVKRKVGVKSAILNASPGQMVAKQPAQAPTPPQTKSIPIKAMKLSGSKLTSPISNTTKRLKKISKGFITP